MVYVPRLFRTPRGEEEGFSAQTGFMEEPYSPPLRASTSGDDVFDDIIVPPPHAGVSFGDDEDVYDEFVPPHVGASFSHVRDDTVVPPNNGAEASSRARVLSIVTAVVEEYEAAHRREEAAVVVEPLPLQQHGQVAPLGTEARVQRERAQVRLGLGLGPLLPPPQGLRLQRWEVERRSGRREAQLELITLQESNTRLRGEIAAMAAGGAVLLPDAMLHEEVATTRRRVGEEEDEEVRGASQDERRRQQ